MIEIRVQKPQRRRVFLVLLAMLFVACAQPQQVATPGVETRGQPNEITSAPAIQLDGPLSKRLDTLLQRPEFAKGRWGITVLSIANGKIVYEHNGGHLFTPASNMKLFTTAVALDLLGADYRWRTSLYADNNPDQNGTINGDLVLYGRGAPDLLSVNSRDNRNSLEELVTQLKQRGIKQVRGDVIGDESYFRGDPIGQGWQWNDLQWYFGAEASALTINGNSTDISVTSAAKADAQPTITVNDTDHYTQVTNDMKTVASGSKMKIGVYKGLTDNNVRVWGEFPLGARGYGVNLSVHRPSHWAARLLVTTLKANGIEVTGTARWRDSRSAGDARFKPEEKKEVAFVTGKSLGEITKTTNKLSVNLYAELILRTLGRERRALLADPDPPGREFGDDEVACKLMNQWLGRNGIDATALAFHDGSGLSRLDLVSPNSLAGLLNAMTRSGAAATFLDSLPISSKDGTLGGRLASLSERVQAKTGTLTYDNSLSGYLTTNDGQRFAFSVICNDSTIGSNANRLIDMVVTTIAGPDSPEKPAHEPPRIRVR